MLVPAYTHTHTHTHTHDGARATISRACESRAFVTTRACGLSSPACDGPRGVAGCRRVANGPRLSSSSGAVDVRALAGLAAAASASSPACADCSVEKKARRAPPNSSKQLWRVRGLVEAVSGRSSHDATALGRVVAAAAVESSTRSADVIKAREGRAAAADSAQRRDTVGAIPRASRLESAESMAVRCAGRESERASGTRRQRQQRW